MTSNARDIHVDTETEKWITVGNAVTLSSKQYTSWKYSHEWSIDKASEKIVSKSGSGSSITVTGLKEGTATVKDKVTWTTGVFWQQEHEDTITYTVHVLAKKSATGITITGANEVTQFKNINLTYTLTPAGAEGTVQWSSSNEDILTVDSSGKVTGLRRGQATVTANVYSGQSLLCSATKTIQVVEDTTVTGESATVYYLLDPTKDANSNDTGNWGSAYGIAKVNVTGATWTGGKNCFDNVDQRVVSWPNGTNVVTRNSEAWNQIFNNYKSSVEQQLGVPITKDDVVSITLRPAKISRNNGTNPDKHLDCNVDVNCKGVSIVHYYLLDKSSDPNSTEYVHQGSKSYINGSKTDPEAVTGKSFPTTKTGTDGATYTFSGWYTDQELTQPATFPYTVNSNVNFYAKYVAGRQVVYNLNGGSFSDGSSLTEKHNEGENVVVKSEPTRKGYKFTGWTVEGLDGVSSIDSRASFQMPNNNVTITAKWEEQKIEDFITLTPTDVTEVYNGEAHAAGTATVSGKKVESNLDGVKIEYQKADGTWTENPAESTATNVSDSTTVKVRVTSENYTGKLEDTEELTITKRPIEITGSGWTSSQPYTGNEYRKDTYEVEGANEANTRGLVAGETATVSYEIKGTNVGPYTGTFGNDFTVMKDGVDVTANYTVTKTPGTLTISKAEINQYVTLNPRDVEEVYDGTAHEAGVATATDSNGNELKIEYSVDGTNWTTDPGTITATEVKDSVTVNVRVSSEGNYDGYVTGTEKLTITKRPITITGSGWTSSQPYTGKAYTKTDYEVEQADAENTRGLVAGETATVSYEITGTNVGLYTGTFGDDLEIKTAGGILGIGAKNVTDNYTVTKTPGTLTISKAEINQYVTLNPRDVEEVYDGTAHEAGVATATDSNGNELKIEYSVDGTNWTTDPGTITATEVKDSVTVNVRVSSEGNYDGYVTGTEKLTITARPITITGDGWTSSQPYTGKAYTKTDYEVEQANAENTRGLVAGETVNTSYEIKGTNVGSYTGTFGDNFEIKTAGGILGIGAKDVTDNYTVTKTSGTLTISKAEILNHVTLTPNPVTKVYDGEAHTAGIATVTADHGNEVKVEYSVNGTDWTTDPSTITATEVKDSVTVLLRASSEGNYEGYVTGKEELTITKRPITITGDGWTSDQPYTGSEYKKTTYTAEEANAENTRGLVAGETATVSYEIAGTNVGTYTGTFGNDFTVMKDGVDVTDNYTVTKTSGTLTISKAEINQYVTLNPRDVAEVYDGTAHEAGVATATDSNGNELKIEYSVDGTNWTTDPGTITATEVKDSVTVNVRVSSEGNYDGYVTGTEKLTITKRPIMITGSGWDADQVYTGKEYKKTEYTVEEANVENTRGLVAGETATVSYEIKGANVGPYTGTFEDNFLVKKGNKDVTSNYEPVKEEGTLRIVTQSITPGPDPENPDPSYDGIQIDSPSDVEYDGQAHKWSPTVTDKNGNALTEGTDYEVSYDKDDFTDVKTITVTITGKGNYTGTVTRVYNILAAPLIIRTEKAEKTYDGKPLTNENMTIEGLKNGEVVAHKTTGTQTEVGNSDNTYELDWESKETTAKESNYIIKEVSLGKLVVKETEDEIVVTTTGGTFTYDGQPHGATVEVSELPEGYTLQTAESDATATDVTTEAVTADADRLVIVNAAGVDVTANLKITRVTGEIVVNPATVTVTTPNASKVYDGTPLTAAGTITGLVNGETVSFATTGTITNVGTATNSYSLVWDQTAKETNYTVSENLGTLTVTAPANNNPSVTPAPPATPNPPATPSDNPGVLDRVVDTIKDVAADVQEVFSSDDGDVPLANQNLDEHKCCILHFLIMLLTAILYGFFTHNMKKRQKKNFELREELDTELVKRGLPTSKEQKNS